MNREQKEKAILIVKDDFLHLKLIRDLLKLSGYTILEAFNGKQGVDIAREKKPNLILMDVRLPDIDGAEATKILKADVVTKDIPIVAVSSCDIGKKMGEAGCCGYITFPIKSSEFMKEVADYL